ncbi:NACHT, LRR and PYD domains-containing protein 3-like isoform X3 [Heterodontus francisci]
MGSGNENLGMPAIALAEVSNNAEGPTSPTEIRMDTEHETLGPPDPAVAEGSNSGEDPTLSTKPRMGSGNENLGMPAIALAEVSNNAEGPTSPTEIRMDTEHETLGPPDPAVAEGSNSGEDPTLSTKPRMGSGNENLGMPAIALAEVSNNAEGPTSPTEIRMDTEHETLGPPDPAVAEGSNSGEDPTLSTKPRMGSGNENLGMPAIALAEVSNNAEGPTSPTEIRMDTEHETLGPPDPAVAEGSNSGEDPTLSTKPRMGSGNENLGMPAIALAEVSNNAEGPTSPTEIRMDTEHETLGPPDPAVAEGSNSGEDPTLSTKPRMGSGNENLGMPAIALAEVSNNAEGPTSPTEIRMDTEHENLRPPDPAVAEGSNSGEDPTLSRKTRMDSEDENQKMPVTSMAEGSNCGESPRSSSEMRMDADPNSTVTEFFTNYDDQQLFQLTKFYQDRLQQAIEEGVDGLSSLLTYGSHFSGEEHRKIIELTETGNRADSSILLLNLVMAKGSRARRLMWESFVKMRHGVPKLDKILNEIQELGSNLFDHKNITQSLSEVPVHLKDVQQKHKETLRVQTETLRVNTILIKEKVKIFQLLDRYAELTVISTVRDRTLVEHELLARGRDHEEWREKHLQRELEKIQTDQLFQSSFSWTAFLLQKLKSFFWQSSSGSSAVVSGVPGIGKTTMIQKIVYDWATGKVYPNFQFVFSFKFRDLNTINCRINLRNLILDQYPYFRNVLGELWKNPEGLLFIFDGLDEFKDTIDFADNRRNTEPQYMCTDPECCCEVSDIVYSLIQHKLLPGCSVLVTSRPTALHLLEKAEISVWTEILGFVGDERKEYFNKFFEDQTLAAAVFKHVEENEILYTMCYNPSYCWILCLSLGPFFTQRDKKQQQVPKTVTQLYSYYIYNILKNHSREIENPRDVLLKIGEMAFTGVSEKKIVFRDGDLIEYNLQPSQFLSGFLMELLERDDSAQSVVYTFPHLTIQEFVAALTQFLTPDPGDVQKLLRKAYSEKDGRFEIFLRFVAGLSSPQAAWPLEKSLGSFLHQTTCQVIDWVKEKVTEHTGNTESEIDKRDLLNTLHYLFESQNKALAENTVGSERTLHFCGLRLTPIDCAVLSHGIGLCETIKHLDLQSCNIDCPGLKRLEPVLHKCRELRLGNNELGNSGAKLLSAALRTPNCKIQKLGLEENSLTASCAGDLAFAVSTNQSLLELNLSGNKLGDTGVILLFVPLRDPNCKIQKLQLGNVGLTASCIEDLAAVLSTNLSLTELNLSENKLGDLGVKQLSEAMSNPDCKIQELKLSKVGLTSSCVKDLVSTLSVYRSLTVLDLGDNKLGDSGIKQLSMALSNPNCKIQKLQLCENGLSASSTKDLISALSTNWSLIELDLGRNKLRDAGVKPLSEALNNPNCKIQKLWLDDTRLTDSCAEDLASAVKENRSLTVLNLDSNSFTDKSVPALRRLIQTCSSLEQIELLENKFTSTGKDQLKSLHGSRCGLHVELSSY